jgi:hypothetical protein
MKVGYEIAVLESDDPYISIAEEALTGAAEAVIPGIFWVDFFSYSEIRTKAGFQVQVFKKRRLHV